MEAYPSIPRIASVVFRRCPVAPIQKGYACVANKAVQAESVDMPVLDQITLEGWSNTGMSVFLFFMG
jgi:hypothetical protein